MNSKNELEKVLSFLASTNKINIEDVLDHLELMKNKEILEQHKNNYTIWQGKNSRWYSYLPDETKPSGRRQIVKSSQEHLERQIILYYKDLEQKNSNTNIENLYSTWLSYKEKRTPSSRTIRIVDNLYKKYYLNTHIIKVPLPKLTTFMLDEWAHDLISTNDLTKKQYYNMAVIMRQLLDYAVYVELIPDNPFSRVKINSKLFRVVKKKKDKTQVFLLDEQAQIELEALNDYKQNAYLACLAIPLTFQTGMRLGEIVALKWTDMEEKPEHIHIQRMESKDEQQNDNGKWYSKRIVVEHGKTSASDRYIYLTEKAKNLLSMIQTYHKDNNINSEYIFVDKSGNRIHEPALDTRIRKYCRYCDINEKSMHKIRKTYVSALIDANININYIREQVGHEDERTTYNSYCYNRKSENQTHLDVEKALEVG